MVSQLVTGRAKIARLAAKSKTQALRRKKKKSIQTITPSKQSSLSLGKLFLLQLTKYKGPVAAFVRLALRDMN